MSSKRPDLASITKKNSRLRERLAAAESALRSMRNGPNGQQAASASEQALLGSEARLRAMFEMGVDAMITIDTRGVIESVNPATERIFGWRKEEMLGRNVKMLMPEPDRTRHGDYIANYQRTHERHVIGIGREVTGIRKSGELFPIDLAVTEVRLTDRTIFMGTIRDITARKQTEAELQRAREEAVAASKAKDNFIAIISHELRNPLAPVLMTSSDLEDDASLSPELRDSFRMIRENIELEAQLIDDLLDFTRITHGKLRVTLKTISVHHVIHQTLETLRAECERRRIRLVTNLEADRDLIQGDAGRLKQVCWNLLNNALKFTEPGGLIDVRTKNSVGDKIRIGVTDTGKGIEAQDLERIFKPFDQGAARTDDNLNGLGLGLAIAKTLVDLHGGNIAASSAGFGQGATFHMDLPLSKAAETTGNRETPPNESGRLKILLTEDNRDCAEVLARLLRKWGNDVSIAHTSAEALEMAGRESFELIVSDIGLPDGDGWELMRALHARFGLRGIALSGFGMEADIARSRDAGFTAHLVKPINVRDLRKALESAQVA